MDHRSVATIRNDSRAKTLELYPVETRPDETDPTRVQVSMPVGAEIVDVVNTANGLAVATLHHPNATAMRVAHPLVLLPAGAAAVPLLGRTLGAALGLVDVQGSACAVLPEFPWPTSALQS